MVSVEPPARLTCPTAKPLLLAWSWPPELTSMAVALPPLLLLAALALKAVLLACISPPLPTTIWAVV